MPDSPKYLSSTKNPLIKEVADILSKSKLRKDKQLFVVEGLNEVALCLKSGYFPEHVFYHSGTTNLELVLDVVGEHNARHITEVSKEVFSKIAYRSEVENIVMLARSKGRSIDTLELKERDFVIVAEGVEKPGNLGALLRTADALGVSAVILADARTDLFNPNVIRSSVGSVFALPVVECSKEEAAVFLQQNSFSIYTTFMSDSVPSWDIEYPARTAMVVGEEHSGLSEFWKSLSTKNVNIPMKGLVDSLNVSVAVSILSYEVIRQQSKSEV